MLTEQVVLDVLEEVKDPEIPVISVVDLGVIHAVYLGTEEDVRIEMTPTFAGCPAIGYMKADILEKLAAQGIHKVQVDVLYNEPWTTNKITPKGRQILKDFGLSPPPAFDGILTLEVLQNAMCPNCGSNNTTSILLARIVSTA